jgi:hypothetical protein
MAQDVHVTTAGVTFHSDGRNPVLPKGVGQPVVAAVKSPGQPNGNVSGQVANSSVVIQNPD